jgi:sarcosine oxidase
MVAVMLGCNRRYQARDGLRSPRRFSDNLNSLFSRLPIRTIKGAETSADVSSTGHMRKIRQDDMDKVYDAIVLGLGAVGAAAAYQLRKRGAAVLGIDQFKPPHEFGSSHGDSRITRIACGEGLEYTAFAVRSHEIWRELEAQTGLTLLTQNGLLVISGEGPRAIEHEKPHFFETTVQAAVSAGISHEVLTGAEASQRYPIFKLNERDHVYHDRLGGFVRPEACVEAQLQVAQREGAVLRFHEKVLGIQEGDLVTVETQAGRYRAKQVILAMGPWLPEFCRARLHGQLQVMRQVMYWFPIRSDYARREDFSPERLPSFIWQLPAPQPVYGFPAIDGPDKGVKIATEQSDFSTTPELVDRTVSADEKREMYETYVAPFFSGLAAEPMKTKVCLYTCAPQARFLIDRFGRQDNVIVASACSGHGFKHSAAVGELLAKMALGESHLDIERFRLPV